MPDATTKTRTATKFTTRLNRAVSVTESGMTIRGKRIFRTRFSRSTMHLTAAPVVSEKNVQSMIELSR